jgi:hypothetical protein
MIRFTGLVSLFLVLRVAVCQESPIRGLNVLIGKQVIVQRTALCQPGTFTYSLAYAGKQGTVVSLKPSNLLPLTPGAINRLSPAARALVEDQQKAATILVRFEDGAQLDSCAPIAPSRLSDHFELAPGQTLEAAPASAPVPTSPPAPPSSPVPAANLQPATTTLSSTAIPSSPPQPCPVEIKKIDTANGFKANLAGGLLYGPNVHPHYQMLTYMNASTKDVVSVRFKVEFLNALREVSEVVVFEPEKESKLKPGKAASLVRATYLTPEGAKASGWVEKILFSDGTYWNDDGSHSCDAPKSERSK